MSKEKFKRGSRVRVIDADERRPVRSANSGEVLFIRSSHRDNYGGDEAIIVSSYRQQYGGGAREAKMYTLTVLNAAGKPVNKVSWFDEDQLELINDDSNAGHDIIDAYLDQR